MKTPLLALATTLCLSLAARAHDVPAAMTTAAQTFLASLDTAQKTKATYPLDDAERLNWHFIPKERNGLTLKEMNPAQRHLAYSLLGTGLSDDGFTKATTIMSLEQILRELENAPEKRDPEKYHFTIFGEPKAGGVWGWRCEGHHCSVNFTLVDGQISGTPIFFGTNPGVVKEGPRQGLRVLGHEESLGRALAKSLTPEQFKTALLPGDAPKEVLSEALKKVDPIAPSGIAAKDLTDAQKKALREVISAYVDRLEGAVADVQWKEIDTAGFDNLRFTWIGGTEVGQPHYYRVQGPTFLVEYDNTQNGANHPHAVWREFNGDFGADLLKAHMEKAHAK